MDHAGLGFVLPPQSLAPQTLLLTVCQVVAHSTPVYLKVLCASDVEGEDLQIHGPTSKPTRFCQSRPNYRIVASSSEPEGRPACSASTSGSAQCEGPRGKAMASRRADSHPSKAAFSNCCKQQRARRTPSLISIDFRASLERSAPAGVDRAWERQRGREARRARSPWRRAPHIIR